jgi:hypothetical protein
MLQQMSICHSLGCCLVLVLSCCPCSPAANQWCTCRCWRSCLCLCVQDYRQRVHVVLVTLACSPGRQDCCTSHAWPDCASMLVGSCCRPAAAEVLRVSSFCHAHLAAQPNQLGKFRTFLLSGGVLLLQACCCAAAIVRYHCPGRGPSSDSGGHILPRPLEL